MKKEEINDIRRQYDRAHFLYHNKSWYSKILTFSYNTFFAIGNGKKCAWALTETKRWTLRKGFKWQKFNTTFASVKKMGSGEDRVCILSWHSNSLLTTFSVFYTIGWNSSLHDILKMKTHFENESTFREWNHILKNESILW